MTVVKAMDFLSRANEVLLASGSPRRLELIQKLNAAWISQLSIPESVENLDWRKFDSARQYVESNVKKKLEYALGQICIWTTKKQRTLRTIPPGIPKEYIEKNVTTSTPSLVIAADTVVINRNEVLEKPKSVQHNYEMLPRLNGIEHSVLTAVSFVFIGDERNALELNGHQGLNHPLLCRTFCTETSVQLMNLNEETLRWYANTPEGSDKAGGYAIQGLGAALVESVKGDFYNVVGFPVSQFVVHLNELLP